MQTAARDNAMASEARGAFNETPLWVRCPPSCFAGRKSGPGKSSVTALVASSFGLGISVNF